MSDLIETHSGRARLAARCRGVCEAPVFSVAVISVILLNAVLLGVETYSGLSLAYAVPLHAAERFCVAAFSVEMLIRLGAHADRPKASSVIRGTCSTCWWSLRPSSRS